MLWSRLLPGCGIAAAIASVFGCATVMPDEKHAIEAREQVSRVDRHGAFPAVRRIYFEQVNLVELIDPRMEAAQQYKTLWEPTESYPDERKWGVRYDLVLAWFRNNGLAEEAKRLHRNSVQDRILAVSTSRCNVFKTYLRRQQADVNYLLGSATTAAGVLGAVLGGVNSSRNLSGAAGLFSGLQAEYNQTYYNNLTAHVIVQGIELAQARLQKQLIEARSQRSIAEYSMEAAINDAIYIDGSCSTVAGLQEAAESIRQVSNPGLVFAAQVIASSKALREIEQGDYTEMVKTGKLEELLKKAAPAGPPLIASLVKADAAAGVNAASLSAADALQRTIRLANTTATTVGRQFVAAQSILPKESRTLKELTDIEQRAVEVQELFRTHAHSLILQLPFASCVDKLKDPAKAVAAALVEQASAGADEVKRLSAAHELALAKANTAAAVAKIELLVNSAAAALDNNAKRWIELSRQDSPQDSAFVGEFKAADFRLADLAKVCK